MKQAEEPTKGIFRRGCNHHHHYQRQHHQLSSTKRRTRERGGCICCLLPHSGRSTSFEGRRRQLPPDIINSNHNDCGQSDDNLGSTNIPRPRPQQHSNITKSTIVMKRKKLKPALAREIAAMAQLHSKEIAKSQPPIIRAAALMNVALFEQDEVIPGRLLGVGGFSIVREINSFVSAVQESAESFETTSSSKKKCSHSSTRGKIDSPGYNSSLTCCRWLYTREQLLARQRVAQQMSCCPLQPERQGLSSHQQQTESTDHFPEGVFRVGIVVDNERCGITAGKMGKHPWIAPSFKDKPKCGAGTQSSIMNQKEIRLFVIKHLKPDLMNSPDKFAKAAIDLACEAELLLCMDHPHIVKLHGYSSSGPNAYKSGEHNSFFIILDRLVETLHDRVYSWRQQSEQIHEIILHTKVQRRSLIQRFTKIFDVQRHSSSAGFRDQNKPGKTCKVLGQIPQKCCNSCFQSKWNALLLERLIVAHDIASAIQYVHERGIIYRDLKTTNVGFDLLGKVKLFDFGLSRYLPPITTGQVDELYCMSNVGTKRYCAPEVIHKRYNLKADVYSFGVMLWEILTLNSPRPPPRHCPGRGPLFDSKILRSCPCWPITIQNLVAQMQQYEYQKRPPMDVVQRTLKTVVQNRSEMRIAKIDAIASEEANCQCVDSSTFAGTLEKCFDCNRLTKAAETTVLSVRMLAQDQQTSLNTSRESRTISSSHF